MRRARAGFSLIELLVAVAVFALASALAWAGLSAVADNRQRLAQAQDDFAAVQRSVDFLARDLATAVDRPVRVSGQGLRPALIGDMQRISLTRKGLASELQSADSALERVSWFVDGKSLLRGRQAVLDRPDDYGFSKRSLHAAVETLSLRYLDRQGRWQERWPPGTSAGEDDSPLPRAVEFRIRFAGQGEIRRVVELPSARAVESLPPGAGT